MGKPIHVVLYSILYTTVNLLFFVISVLAYIIQSIVKHLIPGKYNQPKCLAGEVVLVTGGGGGLGRLLAMRLAKLKAIVVLWDVNMKGVDETVKLVETIGEKAYGYKCDLSNKDDVYRVAALTKKEVGEVSILINNAGVVSGKFFLDTPDHLIQRTFDVNILSHFWTTKAFLPNMLERDHGHIVTIASMAGYVGINKLVDYCASKYAAVGFDESLRIELEAQGVRGVKTTVICPYFLQSTGMFENVNSFIPTLRANDVADRIIDGIRHNDKFILIPGCLKYMLALRWIMPWKAISLFLRGLVPDAAPTHETPATQPPVVPPQPKVVTLVEKSTTADVTMHHRITTASERKP